jgi:hypothetical protein
MYNKWMPRIQINWACGRMNNIIDPDEQNFLFFYFRAVVAGLPGPFFMTNFETARQPIHKSNRTQKESQSHSIIILSVAEFYLLRSDGMSSSCQNEGQ